MTPRQLYAAIPDAPLTHGVVPWLGGLILALAVAMLLLTSNPDLAHALPHVDDENAMIADCIGEAQRLCPEELASQSKPRIVRCMIRRKSQISQQCKGHFR